MPKVCFYFQLHQPYRLSDLSVFDIGESAEYFGGSENSNKEIFQKVTRKSYIPMLELLYRLTETVPAFMLSLSCSGVFLEQAQEYEPEVITLLQKLSATGRVEFLAETYYHSLAALYSPTEFSIQVEQHTNVIKKLFNQIPTIFRNTELIYSNAIAEQVASLGFKGMLTEAVERHLHGRPKTRVYQSAGSESLPLLLKHAEFSDDIAFRFSDKNWPEYPLTVEKYLGWLSGYYDEELINLFMDFETFGEHQWEDTGIFTFFETFVTTFAQSEHNTFVTPTQAIRQAISQSLPTSNSSSVISHTSLVDRIVGLFRKKSEVRNQKLEVELPIYDVPQPISWADVDRDITAWVDNQLQQDTLKQMYKFQISNFKDELQLDCWRKLQTSDHFYYMCTKWAADGDVHAYFSPYESPYEAYRIFSIALTDLKSRVVT